jgi:hypothetical protein
MKSLIYKELFKTKAIVTKMWRGKWTKTTDSTQYIALTHGK